MTGEMTIPKRRAGKKPGYLKVSVRAGILKAVKKDLAAEGYKELKKDHLYTDAITAAESWRIDSLFARDEVLAARILLHAEKMKVQDLRERWNLVLCAHIIGMVTLMIIFSM